MHFIFLQNDLCFHPNLIKTDFPTALTTLTLYIGLAFKITCSQRKTLSEFIRNNVLCVSLKTGNDEVNL